MTKKRVLVTLLGIAALVVVAGASMAFAQAPATADNVVTRTLAHIRGLRGDGLVDKETMHAAIAEALGLSSDELEAELAAGKSIVDLAAEQGVDLADVRAAMEAVRADAIAQAVADGLITQEQADRLLSAGANGPAPFPFGGRFGRHGFDFGAGIFGRDQAQAALAGILDMSVDDLEAALSQGRTIVSLAEEAGLTLDQVQTAMEEARAQAIQQAVDEGAITQEQADQLLSQSGKFGPGFHGPGDCGLGHGLVDAETMQSITADALGISVEELQAAHDEGQSIADLAAGQGLELEAVQTAIREAVVQAALDAGTITQEQADQILSGQLPFGFGPHGNRGHGNRGPGFGGHGSGGPGFRGQGSGGQFPGGSGPGFFNNGNNGNNGNQILPQNFGLDFQNG